MQKLEKLRLKGISEILSEKELKNVLGGSGTGDCFRIIYKVNIINNFEITV